MSGIHQLPYDPHVDPWDQITSQMKLDLDDYDFDDMGNPHIDDLLDDEDRTVFWLPDEFCGNDKQPQGLTERFAAGLVTFDEFVAKLKPLDGGSLDDYIFECTCGVKTLADEHGKDCRVRNHEAWRSYQCEWVPELDTYVYQGLNGLHLCEHPEFTFDLINDHYGSVYSAERSKWVTKAAQMKAAQKAGVPSSSQGGGYTYEGVSAFTKKCRHYETAVTLPDGTKVWPSSMNNRKGDDAHPDYGVYFDRGWVASMYPALMVPWPDYGLPALSMTMFDLAVEQVLSMCRAGLTVEFGCIGGHGRTGTFLACLLFRAGFDGGPEAAVDWVHENYCSHAVEGAKQGWFVSRYYAYVNGLPSPPPLPLPPPAPVTTMGQGKWQKWEKSPATMHSSVQGTKDDKVSAIWSHDATLTLNGVCPSCQKMNGIPHNDGIKQSSSTFGFLCSGQGCEHYGTRLNTPFAQQFLADHPSLKILNSKGVRVTIATPAKPTGGTS